MKIYADTSVFGGVFDEEFLRPIKKFFEEVKAGRFLLVTSAVVQAEISAAPKRVQEFFSSVTASAELAEITQEVLELRQAYSNANIVSKKSIDDLTHVALASVSCCNMIVSNSRSDVTI
jgi:predicted nucleic acid-binding protein